MDAFTIILGIVLLLVGLVLGYVIGKLLTEKSWKDKLREIREEAIKKSRAVLGGQFAEQLAPYLPDFPFSPTEARFMGKPIDLIVFKGMDEKDIQEVIFVEIKSGKSRLNTHEKKLADAIKAKKVRWVEYKIPEEVTRKK